MLGGEIDLEKISKSEMGYLRGFFVGDGYKFHDKRSRHYYVEFYVHSVRDKEIFNFLFKIFKKAGLNPQIYHDKRFYCTRIRINNKNLCSFFDKDFKKMDLSKDEIIGFISGFLDAEGYVNNKKSFIVITNTDKAVLDFIKKELNDLGISSSLNTKWKSITMKKQAYNLYISVKFKSVPHLSIKATAG